MASPKQPRPMNGETASCEYLDFRLPPAPGSPPGITFGDSALWVTWEKQRRTTELSQALGLRLFRFSHQGSRFTRYLVLTWQTWILLRRKRPRVLVIQNPSIILAAAAALMKKFMGFKLVVDRHTNFMINRQRTLQIRILTFISDFSLRNSDLTIVSNKALAELVERHGTPAFVLPDRIPSPPPNMEPIDLGPGQHLCFICTYADDEPYNEVIGLAPLLPPEITIHITGRKKNARLTPESVINLQQNDNIILTDFLDELDYWRLLAGVDVVMDLTTSDFCLVCGAYEALALDQPMILSQKQVNQDLFGEAPVLVEANTKDILDGLLEILADLPARQSATEALRQTFLTNWSRKFSQIQTILSAMTHSEQGD